MTSQQAAIVAGAAKRSGPVSSRTSWALYVSQLSMGLFLWQVIDAIRSGASPSLWIVVTGVCGIASLAMCAIGGIAWTDDAVSAIRALRGMPEPVRMPEPSGGPGPGGPTVLP